MRIEKRYGVTGGSVKRHLPACHGAPAGAGAVAEVVAGSR
jgi:hypothetical protein